MEEKYTYLDGKSNSVSKINDTYSSIRKQPNSSGGDEQLYAVVQKGKPLIPKKTMKKRNDDTNVNVAKTSSSDVLASSERQTTGFDLGGDGQLYAVVQKGGLLKSKKTLEKGKNDVNNSIAETPSSTIPKSNEQQTTGFGAVGDGQLYAVVQKGRPLKPKKTLEKGNNDVNDGIAKTHSSSIPESNKQQKTGFADRKWRNTKLVCAIITTLFALAGFCIALVTLIELTSQAEIKQLTVRINGLEEQQQSADTKIMELNVSAESANKSIKELEAHVENTNTSISKLEESLEGSIERTNELEVTVQKNNTDLSNSVQECNNMDTQLANQIAELEETVLKLHVVVHGYEYKLTDEAKNWTDSRTICQNQGGDLAAVGIRNATARNVIGKALLEKSGTAWIGLSEKFDENDFVWVDGMESTKENTPWSDGEPSVDNKVDEDCGLMRRIGDLFEVNDIDCSHTHLGICEIALV